MVRSEGPGLPSAQPQLCSFCGPVARYQSRGSRSAVLGRAFTVAAGQPVDCSHVMADTGCPRRNFTLIKPTKHSSVPLKFLRNM